MISTTTIVDAVVRALEAMRYTPDSGGGAQPLFGEVKRYSSTDIEAAFRALLVSSQRAAVVVFSGSEFSELLVGTGRRSARTTKLSIVVTDRVVGQGDAAVFGSDDTPGACGLADAVCEELIGRVIANPDGVDLVPRSVDTALLADDSKKTLKARSVCVIEFDAHGGTVASPLPRPSGPVA